MLHGFEIMWKMWIEAYEWDITRNPQLQRTHYNLTEEHIRPDNAAKMRNHLAQQVLNSDMLLLMKVTIHIAHLGL
jgi:hypothetical protein